MATAATPAWSQDVEGRVIGLTAGLAVTHDSNVPRANSATRAQYYGSDSLSDTYLRGMVGVNFDRMISQQRLQASAQLDGYKYNNYDQFDNVGYRAAINYDWAIGRPFFGKIGAQIYRYEPQIQDGQEVDGGRERNRIDRQFVYFNGGMRFTPSLSLIVGADFDRRRNSLDVFKIADNDVDAYEGGLRWAPGTGLELDFVYRHSNGDYKNLQYFQDYGQTLALVTPISNNFKQDALLLRATYRPDDDTRLTGTIGQTKRDYDQFSQRDFDGLTLRGDFQWALSGLTMMQIMIARDIEPQDGVFTASYAETTEFAIRPRIRATGRITVLPFYHYIDRKYAGDATAIATNQPDRKDKLHLLGIQADYELTRTVTLYGELRRDRRSSNREYADFRANIVTIGVRATF